MRSIDILLVLIVLSGTILLTYTYFQDRPPYLVIASSEGKGVVVDVYSNNKCSLQITGEVKNIGDVHALGSRVACIAKEGNKESGFGGAQLGEIAPHRSKDFSMNAYFTQCPTTGVSFECVATCENCP